MIFRKEIDKILHIVGGALMLALTACGGGSGESDNSNGGRVISGRVLDQEASVAIPNASVITSPQTASVLTDSNGQFRITDNIALGNSYVVTVSAPGYETVSQTVAVADSSGTTADFLLVPRALSVDKNLLRFGTSGYAGQIRLRATQDTQYSVSSSHAWLTASPDSGALTANEFVVIDILADQSQAPADRITDGWLQFTSQDGLSPVAVNVVVSPTVLASDDSDGDGVADGSDNCPFVVNTSQGDADNDGAGDVCDVPKVSDPDLDGVGALDNCPAIPNASQQDTDNDGIGDLCDAEDNTANNPTTGNPTNVPDGGNSDEILSFAATPGVTMIDEPVMFSWQIAAATDDNTTCLIDVDNNGSHDITIDNCSSDNTAVHHYLEPGVYETSLTVRRTNGQENSLSTSVTVLPLQVSLAVAEFVEAGSRLRLEFTVSNVSNVPVNDVKVLYRIPAGITFSRTTDTVPDTFGCGSCVEGAEADWNFQSIPAGGVKTIMVNALVLDSNAEGTVISNKIDVTATGFSETISQTETVIVKNNPALSVAVAASQDPVLAGQQVEYVVTVGNVSSGNVESLQIRSRLPRGAVADFISDEGSVDQESGEIIWSVTQLPVLQTRRFTVLATMPASIVAGQILETRSSVLESGQSGSTATMTDIVSVTSQPSPLAVDIAVKSDPVEASGRLHYQFTVSNTGLVPINNVELLFRVPAGVQFSRTSDALPDTFGCGSCVEGAEADWSFDSLLAGASETIVVNSSVLDSLQGGSLIDSILLVTSDSTLNDVTLGTVASVDNAPRSQLSISLSDDPVVAGQPFTATVHVGNTSSSNLENISVSMALPDGISVDSVSGSGSESGNGSVSWQVTSLPVLETQRYTIDMTAAGDAIAGHLLGLRGELAHNGGPAIDVAAEQILSVAQVASPLALLIVPEQTEVAAGSRLRYEFLVTNNTLVPVNDVYIVYRVPAGVSFSRTTDAEPDTFGCGSCVEGAEADWTFDSLQSGETAKVTVNILVSDQVQAGSLIDSRVKVTAADMTNSIELSSVVSVR